MRGHSTTVKRQFTYPPLSNPSRIDIRRRCSKDEFFSAAAIALGILSICAGFMTFAAKDVPAWKQFYVPVAYFSGSSLIFWQGVGKKTNGLSNFVMPVSMFFLGNALGFAFCYLWELPIKNQVYFRDDLGKISEQFDEGIQEYLQEIATFGTVGLLTFVLALIEELCYLRRKRFYCKKLIWSTLHLIVVGGALVLTTGFGVFFLHPEKAEEKIVSDWTFPSPPSEWQQMLLLVVSQFCASAACVLALLYRYKGRWLSNVGFACVLGVHICVIVLASVTFSSTPNEMWWSQFTDKVTQIIFVSSATAILLSMAANISYGSSTRQRSKFSEELPMLASEQLSFDHSDKLARSETPAKCTTSISTINHTPNQQTMGMTAGGKMSSHLPSYVPNASQLPSGVIFIQPPQGHGMGGPPPPTAFCITPR